MESYLVFGVFGAEGVDLEPIVGLIGKGRKSFVSLTRDDVIGQAVEAQTTSGLAIKQALGETTDYSRLEVDLIAAAVRERIEKEHQKIIAPVEEAPKPGAPGAKKPAAPAPAAGKGAGKGAETIVKIDDAPIGGPSLYVCLEGPLFPAPSHVPAFRSAGVNIGAVVCVAPATVTDLPPTYTQYTALHAQPGIPLHMHVVRPGETPADTFEAVAYALYAGSYERRAYLAWSAKGELCTLPPLPPPDTKLYARLADAVPPAQQTVPLLLQCMFEQVALNTAPPAEAAAQRARDEAEHVRQLLREALRRTVPDLLPEAELSPSGGGAGRADGADAAAAQTASAAPEQSSLTAGTRTTAGTAPEAELVRYHDAARVRHVAAGPEAATRALSAERAAFRALPVPGVARLGFPAEPRLPESERAAQQTELLHFAHLPASATQRGRVLTTAARMVSGGAAAVAARTYTEEFSAEEFSQRLAGLLEERPAMRRRYVKDEDAVVLTLQDEAPPGRVRVGTFAAKLPTVSGFAAWRTANAAALQPYLEKLAPPPPPPPPAAPVKGKPAPAAPARELKSVPFPPVDECVVALPPPPSFAYQTSVPPPAVTERRLYLHDGSTVRVRETAKSSSAVATLPGGMVVGLRQTASDPAAAYLVARFADSVSGQCVASAAHEADAGGVLTLSTASGLVVQHAPGYVQQWYATPELRKRVGGPAPAEECRRIMGKGTVLRRLPGGVVRMLLVDGTVADRQPDGTTIICNMKGERVQTRPGAAPEPLAPLSVSSTTDPETGDVVTTREDMTMVVRRASGQVEAHHADGTCIDWRADLVTVRAPGFAPVDINLARREIVTVCNAGVQLCTVGAASILLTPGGARLRVAGALATVEAVATSADPSVAAPPGTLTADLSRAVLRADDADGNLFLATVRNVARAVTAAARQQLAVEAAASGMDELDTILSTEPNEEEEEAAVDEAEEEEEVTGDKAADEDEEEAETRAQAHGLAPSGGTAQPAPKAPLAAALAAGAHVSHPPRVFVVREGGSATEFLHPDDVATFIARSESDPQTTILSEPLADDPAARSVTFLSRFPAPVVGAGVDAAQFRSALAAGRVLDSAHTSSAVPTHALLFRVITAAPPLTAAEEEQLLTGMAAFAKWQKQRNAYDASVATAEAQAAQLLTSNAEAAAMRKRYEQQRQERAARQEAEARQRMLAIRSSEEEAARPHSRGSMGASGSIPNVQAVRSTQVEEEDASLQEAEAQAPQIPSPISSHPYAPPTGPRPPINYFAATRSGSEFLKTATRTASMSHEGVPGMYRPPPHEIKPVSRFAGEITAARAQLEASVRSSQPRSVPAPMGTAAAGAVPRAPFPAEDSATAALDGAASLGRPDGALGVTLGGPRAMRNERFAAIEGATHRRVQTASVMQLATRKGPEAYVPGFEVSPGEVVFGTVRTGSTVRRLVTARNVSTDTLRFRVRQPSVPSVRVGFTPRPTAPGMTVQFAVEMQSGGSGPMETEFEIITERDIIVIPVSAFVE